MKNLFLKFLRKYFFSISKFKFTIFGINKFSYVYTQPNGLSHFFGTYELEIKDFIITKAENAKIIYNIGAAYGYYASYFSKKCKKIFLFEPDPSSCNKLKELSKLIKFDFKIENKFVSNFDDNNTISLNKAFKKYGIPDFIKIDIEGGEKNLLDDTYDIIKNKNINMIIELHSQSIEDSITKNLNQYEISYSIVDSYKNTKLIRKVNYMKWLII